MQSTVRWDHLLVTPEETYEYTWYIYRMSVINFLKVNIDIKSYLDLKDLFWKFESFILESMLLLNFVATMINLTLTFCHTYCYKEHATPMNTNQIMMRCCYDWRHIFWATNFSLLVKEIITNRTRYNTLPMLLHKNISEKQILILRQNKYIHCRPKV